MAFQLPRLSQSTSSYLQPFLTQVVNLVQEYDRLHAENQQLKANTKDASFEVQQDIDFDDEILQERCNLEDVVPMQCVSVVPQDPQVGEHFGDEECKVHFESPLRTLSGIPEVSYEGTGQADMGKKGPVMGQAVFQNSSDMKQAVRAELMKDGGYDVKMYYKQSGLFQKIARHPWFENITMFIIGIYAMWMAVDTDLNRAEVILQADAVFFVAEQIFCLYFFVELAKRNCLRDAWFVFDFLLVITMVLETWVMTAVLLVTGAGTSSGLLSNASILRLARLMRLSRLFRMARLLRMVPELLILVKAIAAAMRSVGFTLLLLVIVLYVFGIGFTQLLRGSLVGSDTFPGVFLSMQSLFLHGTLLDSISDLVADFITQEQYLALALLYAFLILSAITIANMLIGVICEVITAVAAAEKEAIQITWVKETLNRVMGCTDENFDGKLQKSEFFMIAQDKDAVRALKELGVDVFTLIDFADMIFEEPGEDAGESGEAELSFADFMEVILQFRGTNMATVKDMVDLRKWFTLQYRQMLKSDLEEILVGKVDADASRTAKKGLRTSLWTHRWSPSTEVPGASVNL
ncbi:unnamed protein product [Effrenium voratum]|uniref:Ion transport domain-containing protein n=1 Tax=Effrenium voratum TaxID=2562239 RepID=A0AA36MQG0_9DINO|nr:unnamed protein product [Effrenium voratum]